MSGVLVALGGGLQTAMLLARGRPDGLARLVAPPAEPAAVARHSFWALALCLPIFLVLDLWGDDGAVDPVTLGIDTLGYLVGWVGFAVLSWEIARRIGRGSHWWRFVAAWNWSNVAQHVLMLAAGLLPQMGAPDWLAEAAWVFAAGWAMWIEWYATRLTLDLTRVAAAGFVVIDILVGLLASAASNALTG
jgi:hypothetical protein